MNKKTMRNARYLEGKLQEFREICRTQGLKITPQRLAIYQELISSKEHPSASAIYEQIKKYYPNISFGTVNSTLLVFSSIGLAKIVESSGDPKRFDPDLEPHHHFRCVKCGKIIDFHNAAYDRMAIPSEIEKRFIILEKKVHLEGLCDKCRTKA
jgi:Fur family peroxide stress response transcriptional regulator